MAATSKTSPVKSGKETIYTATKVIGPNGDGDYTTEIIKYDSGKGDNPRTIATTDKDGKTQWTSNASDEDKKAASEIRKASRSQVKSIADDVTENAEQKEALNKASNNTNEALAAEANAEFYNRAKADVAQAIKNTREEGFSFHIFPETMRVSGNSQDFLKIDMMKYEPRELKKANGSGLALKDLGFEDRDMNRKSIGTVILPIPGGIKDQQQVSWADDKMSAAQIALSDIALSTITEGGEGFVDASGRVIDQAGANISDIKKALSANIAGAAAGANRLLTRQTGAIMNPNMELLFDSPQLRDFTFSFL